MKSPACPYCDQVSALVTGKVIYPHRQDLHSKKFYHCAPCGAYVGCHPGTEKPLGRLANAELRQAKQAAHREFDPMWIGGNLKRSQAYGWLAEQLGIKKTSCHIGEFDVAMCARVVEVCRAAP